MSSNSTTTTSTDFVFGEKDDTVWTAFIAICVVVLLFDIVLNLAFVLKTVYRPTKIFKPKAAPALSSVTNTKTKRFSNGERNESPRRKDHGVMFDVSELGTVSESNSEDSNEENQIRGKYYENSAAVNASVDQQQVNMMMSDRLGIEMTEVRTDADAKDGEPEPGGDGNGYEQGTDTPVKVTDGEEGGGGGGSGGGGATPAVAVAGGVAGAATAPVTVRPLSARAGTPVQMDIPFERVTCGRRIGKGGVGSVYAGELHDVGPVALKKVSVLGDERLQDLAREAKMMAALRHPHIVFLYGLTVSPDEEVGVGGRVDRNAFLVMELCSGDVGSLIDNSPKVKNKDRATPSAGAGGSGAADGSGGDDVFYADRMAVMQKIAQQVADTMEFVHSKDVVHRDLKPANILLKENDDIRIADFGLSKALSNEQHHQTMEIGTPAYMAPELIVGIQDDEEGGEGTEAVIKAPKALDVYAFGILLWSLYMDMHPYPNLGAFQTIYQVKMLNLRPKIPTTASPAMRALLERCWTLEPEARPSFREVNLALAAIISNGDWVNQDSNAKIFVD